MTFLWGIPNANILNVPQAVADPKGAPPTAQNVLNFMQFFGKFGKIVCWRPSPGGLAPPPVGNPGFTPDKFIQEKRLLSAKRTICL